MSRIIAQGQSTIHTIRPFVLADMTFAIEAKDRAQWLSGCVIPSAQVDESQVRPFALYALPANTDGAAVLAEAPAATTALLPHSDSNEPTAPASEAQLLPSPSPEVLRLPVDDLAEAASRAAADAAAKAVAEAVATFTRERERLLQTAQEEAAHCLAQAQEQTNTLADEAYQHGFQQGEAAARQEVAAHLAPVLTTFQQAALDLASLRAEVLRQAEDDVIDLAFQLARKIIDHEVLEHHHVLHTTLQRVLERVADQDRLVIHVHPDDLDEATAVHQNLLGAFGEVKTVSLQADTAVDRGGCLVETRLGTVDARIEAQIGELEQRFRGLHLLDTQARVA